MRYAVKLDTSSQLYLLLSVLNDNLKKKLMLYFNALLTDCSILNVYFQYCSLYQNFDPYYEIIFKLRYAFETK